VLSSDTLPSACPVKFTVVKGNAHFTGACPAVPSEMPLSFLFHLGIGNKKDPVNPVNPVKKEKDFES
jgi:hypothetical protein